MIEAIVIGGSAGAFDALATIFSGLPPHFRTPIALVLHLPPNKPSYLVSVLGTYCPMKIKEAEDKEPLTPETVHIAPPNYHLLVERGGYLSLSVDDWVHFSRPSIDVLFESAADAYGPAVLGVLLTGANEDGARGLARIREAGGKTVVQSPETALVRTMPEAAMSMNSDHLVLALPRIGPFLADFCHRAPPEGTR